MHHHKEDISNGIVNVETVTSQLVYEINGPLYFNSDVVSVLEGITLEQIGKDRVRVCGVKGLPPPSPNNSVRNHRSRGLPS